MSKELESFERIKNITYDRTDLYGIEVYRKDLDIIETTLKEYEKLKECYKNELKNTAYYNNLALKYKRALEIIKEKPIVVLVDYKYTYEEWLELVDEKDKDLFKNKEEYDFLKEILK